MITNDLQLENTRQKLARLEQRVTVVQERLRDEPHSDGVRVTLQSYRQLIRQLREEIGRYELGVQPPTRHRCVGGEQLRNTRRKRNGLDDRIRQAEAAQAAGDPSPLDSMSLFSLRQLRNRLTEEIAWGEIKRVEPIESTAADR